jgi:hypothetical protein
MSARKLVVNAMNFEISVMSRPMNRTVCASTRSTFGS